MRGRTKSFFEDITIFIVVIAIIYGIYSLFNDSDNKNITNTAPIKTELNQSIKDQQTVVKKTKKQIIDRNSSVKTEKQTTALQIEENKEEKKIKPILHQPKKHEVVKKQQSTVKKTKKVVDLKALRAFLIATQYKIRQHLVYPKDINVTNNNNFLKIKITILKDGNYEQLSFVAGNREMFEMNKENILKIFPLTIEDNISDDFPRYLRMNISNIVP